MKPESSAPVFNWKSKKILIVEDDYARFMLIREILSRSKASLYRAVSYKEAFHLISKTKGCDLIIINSDIPGNEYCRVVTWIKLLWPGIPVIAIAGSECKGKNKNCYPLSCNVIMGFDIDRTELLETVNEFFFTTDREQVQY